MNQAHERRRGRTDRRDASRPAMPPGCERRAAGGCRRRLPEPRWRQWPSITLAAVLGVATAFGLQALQGSPVAAAPVVVVPAVVPVEARAEDLPVMRIGLVDAQALRDAACALTPAGVALDEEAQAVWLPRVAAMRAAAGDPRVAGEVQAELREALAALERVGIAGR